jgi:uncharacterized protein (TIGR02594 family)
MRLIRRRATLLLCAVAVAGFAGSAAARPAHKASHHLHAATKPHDVRTADGQPYPFVDDSGLTVQAEARGRRKARVKTARARHHAHDAFGGYTSNSLVSEARKYLGTNPTGRGSLWCGAFMDLVLKRTGHKGGGNLARAYARYGTRVSGPEVGAIAVMGRRGGGHVGVVSGIDPNGNPIIVSGNHNHTVAESVYPAGRIIAYVMPGG